MEVAHGEIVIDVRDREALAALRRLENEVDRAMDNIGREKAVAEADLETAGFDQGVKNIKRRIRELEGQKARVDIDDEGLAEVTLALKEAQKELKRLDGKRAQVEIDVKGDDEVVKALAKVEKADERMQKTREAGARKAQNIARKSATDMRAAGLLEVGAYREEQRRHTKRLADLRAMGLQESAAYREEKRRHDGRLADIQTEGRLEARAHSEDMKRTRESGTLEARAHGEDMKRTRDTGTLEARAHAEDMKRTRERGLLEVRALEMDRKRQAAIEQEIAQLPKLRSEYAKLMREVKGYDAKRRKVGRTGDKTAVLQVEIDQEAALIRMAAVRQALERANALDPLDADLNISPGRDAGLKVREAFKRGGASSAAAEAGRAAGTTFVTAFQSRSSRLNKVDLLAGAGSLASRGLSRIGGLAEGLSKATVRIGPFTATIKQALVGLSALGPAVVNMGGALVALGGVAGSAALGFGALSAGFVAGAIPAALGFGLVIRGVAKDIGKARTASDAYNKAVSDYGKGSEQAAKASEKLKSVLGSVDDSTVKAFTSAQKLNSRWKELTQPARAAVFNTIGDAINGAGKGMEQFAKKTNTGMQNATTAVRGWIQGLSSGRGQQVLGNIMDNFNASIGPALDGLGNLGAAFGKLASVASGFLPGFARQFKAWSDGVNDSADNTNQLKTKVEGWVDSLRSAGNFLRSFGNLMKTVFSGGTAAGRGLLDTMTAAMNRWNEALSSQDGQESLTTFFARASEGARALFSVIGPIVATFVAWASAIAPVTTALAQIAGAVTGVVAKILSLTALQGPIQALAATLATLWAVGKIGAASVAVGNFTRAMLGLKAASVGVAAAGGAAGALGTAGAAAGGAAAAKGITKAGVAAGAAAGRFAFLKAQGRTLFGMLTGRVALLNPLSASIAAVGISAYTAGKYFKESYEENNKLQAALQGGGDAARAQIKNIDMTNASWKNNQDILGEMPAIYSNFKNSSLSVEAAQRGVAQALKTSGRGSLEHRTALQQLNDTQIQARGASKLYEQAVTRTEQNNSRMLGQTTQAYNRAKKTRDEYYAERKGRGDTDQEIKENEHWQNLTDDVSRYGDAVQQAKDIVAASGAQMQRAFQGLAPLIGQAEQQVGRLARRAPKLAVKIATKFEAPKDAGRVAAKAGQALRAGVPKNVTAKIVADSRNAEQAIKRLQRVRINAIRVRILQQGGEKAISMVQRLVGARLAPKVLRIMGSDQSARSKVQALIDMDIPPKIARMLGNNSDALSKAAQANATQLNTLSQVIQRTISNPPDLYSGLSAITQVVNRVVRGGGGADGAIVSFASGGTGAGPDQRQIARAKSQAAARPARDMRAGGKVSRPTMLVGEENKTEVVIPTNPRYRKRSQALLKFAARAIGEGSIAKGSADEGLISAAAGFNPSLTNLDSGGSIGKVSEGKNFSTKKQQKKFRKMKKKKKQRFAADNTNPWVGRLNSLDTKQSDLEREASIRESDFQEPEDFIIETKSKDAEGNNVSRYTFDERAYATWTAEMNQVREVYTALQRVVAEIQQAIPKARSFTNLQIGGHNQNISELQKSLNKERKKKFGSGNEDGRARRDKRVTKLEGQLQKEKDQLTKRKEFKTGLTERGKEAGFDYREFIIASNNIALELGEAKENANEQIADGNDTSGTGGGGGGDGPGSEPSSQLSYGQQVAAGAIEKQSVLREFGSNMNPSGGQTAIGSASGDTGGRGASGGSSGSGFGGSAIMGSGAAMASAGSGGWSSADRAAQSGSASGYSSGGSGTSSAPGTGGGDNREIYITNNYQEGPSDPHTWSRGMEYEMGTM